MFNAVSAREAPWRDDQAQSALPNSVMAWPGLVDVAPLVDALGAGGIRWLTLGSALATAAIVFYVNDEGRRHADSVWNLFAIGGRSSHFTVALPFV